MKINRLKLSNFRNHASYHITPQKNVIAITGINGAGKTNILEALSLLVPGKGIRKAKLSELQKQDVSSQNPWSIFAEVENQEDVTSIGTGFDPDKYLESGKEKRLIRINGENQRGQNSLSEYTCMIWLTPSQDQTFNSGTSARELLDNICEMFFPDYSSQMAVYNNARSQRRRLLAQNRMDDHWLSALESQMAQKAVSLSYSRLEVLGKLNKAMSISENSGFPKALLEIEGELENILKTRKALEAENEYISLLKNSRMNDAYSGKTSFGPHRTYFKVTHIPKSQIAELCSTGEQKALLLSIILASVAAKRSWSGITPIVLLDEIIAHLDEDKRTKLLQFLLDVNAQVWATGTDEKHFSSLGENVQNILL